MHRSMRHNSCILAGILLASLMLASTRQAAADVKLPALFTDHMVLQRDIPCRIWGTADAGEKIAVVLGDQTKEATAGDDGKWMVKLDPLAAGGPHKIVIEGKNRLVIEDVLVGEVWVCSGQSNMAWQVSNSDDADLEIMCANYPKIRLISVPQIASQEPRDDFRGQWDKCSPETVGSFSAVGYFFGRHLHQVLDVPIGLIDNAWGGSACEAWIPRDVLAQHDVYDQRLAYWDNIEKTYDHDKAVAKHEKQLEDWKQKVAQAKEAGRTPPRRPRGPSNPLMGNQRPANLYQGVLNPIIGYGIRGAIWYQGESNAGRAYQYRHMFPLMITTWRDAWKQGDFPFYWVQLADFRNEVDTPAESGWAELREAQTMTLSLPKTGQAVIVDLGEGRDIHPRNKQGVATRLARWALANDYGVKIPYRSPEYKSMERQGAKIVVTFDHTGERGLYTFDVNEPVGFTIAGADKKFVHAQAKIIAPNKIEVWSDEVSEPAAVRYAWADNPICNVQSRDGLPVTPFRTDDWPGVTANER